MGKILEQLLNKGEKKMEFDKLEERMNKTLSVLEENFSEIRAGRANPAVLNMVLRPM